MFITAKILNLSCVIVGQNVYSSGSGNWMIIHQMHSIHD